ncbi:unnamed protein product [Rotaria sordida]|uniref:Uncharacterized protein n=1 Tax=Rotaria sordida TaxID=392033 RepID=A0A814MDS0_9BILA|nr:unnamed protein product [Rotaria sordida]CAF1149998.1 unnamed protein product [Rotaria sordida]CAF1266731.1 unnamed protein product [Rotaria sordida]CAF1460995.1 unnamed protein product [Rotaria sordida]CAF3639435.1 unnamed protein product [Rotaria sordida]
MSNKIANQYPVTQQPDMSEDSEYIQEPVTNEDKSKQKQRQSNSSNSWFTWFLCDDFDLCCCLWLLNRKYSDANGDGGCCSCDDSGNGCDCGGCDGCDC